MERKTNGSGKENRSLEQDLYESVNSERSWNIDIYRCHIICVFFYKYWMSFTFNRCSEKVTLW